MSGAEILERVGGGGWGFGGGVVGQRNGSSQHLTLLPPPELAMSTLTSPLAVLLLNVEDRIDESTVRIRL